jgi:hypothetical protein
MKTYILCFISIFLLSFGIKAQVSKIIIDDQSGLINDANRNYLNQVLAAEKIKIDDFLDYENRCDYTYIFIAKLESEFVLSARDCDKVAKG